MTSSLAQGILTLINDDENAQDTRQISKGLGEQHQKVVGAVKSLQSLGNVIQVEQKVTSEYQLTEEGKLVLAKGSYEAIVVGAIKNEAILDDLLKVTGLTEALLKIGLSKAVQNGWVKVTTENNVTRVKKLVVEIQDEIQALLQVVAANSAETLSVSEIADLKRRKLITLTNQSYFLIYRGPGFCQKIIDEGLTKQESDVTAELMINNDYERKIFKSYNFDARGVSIASGHMHPIQKMRTELITILTEMGFSEMATNRFAESSFWNFDTLFVPQKHPARDAQDTFFLSRPETCVSLPDDYVKRIEKVHTTGDHGSEGYGSAWRREEAVKNVLRTHTTAVSARVLYEHGQNPGPFKPLKKFSIDRVFRNETLDATHLAEFHQVEGFVADENLSLGHLIGIMKEFFGRLGISELKFKPAYNPYTEPSLEVFAFHPGLNKWVEVGNSGVFRPEMLRPMGFPGKVTVIAWGLSLERPTMIRYGIDNIRDLVGHKVDLRMVYNNGLCRLDKH